MGPSPKYANNWSELTFTATGLEAGQASRTFAGLLKDPLHRVELPAERFWQWNRFEPLYSHNAAIREGRWKLVRPFVTRNIPKGPSDVAVRLYDLENDPGESRDVGADHPQLRERLVLKLEKWSREVEQDRVRPMP